MDTKQPTTTTEAGRKGGMTTATRHGREHYSTIGSQGAARRNELTRLGRELEALRMANEPAALSPGTPAGRIEE